MELSADWVVGFVDGEGCFYVEINKHPEMAAKFQVLPEFRVVQHKRDIQVLYAIKRFFRCGVVRRNHDDKYEFRIGKLECLKKIVEFFQKHPLKTKKNIDFRKFAKIVRKMEKEKHLTNEGLKDIVKIAMDMNTGNHTKLKEIYDNL